MTEHDQRHGRTPFVSDDDFRSGDQESARGSDHHGGGWHGVWWVAAATLAVVYVASATGPFAQSPSQPGRSSARWSESLESPAVFTPAHRSVVDAIRDFLGVRQAVVQPIAFPHNVHIANRLGCTDYCHASVAVGPIAGLPSVKTCMICHGTIAIDRPEVQKAAAYRERGEDIAWQRVYGYSRSAHVRFNHAPHVRARVQCVACHGDVAKQTVATRSVDLTMGFCVSCHRQKDAPTDCLTCHF